MLNDTIHVVRCDICHGLQKFFSSREMVAGAVEHHVAYHLYHGTVDLAHEAMIRSCIVVHEAPVDKFFLTGPEKQTDVWYVDTRRHISPMFSSCGG